LVPSSGDGVFTSKPLPRVHAARLKLALLDPQIVRQLRLVVSNLVDELLGVLAADEHFDRFAENMRRR
jgi:hypothetical protein